MLLGADASCRPLQAAQQVKGNKMLQFINWRMRIQISETRTLLGTFMAYDKHMNLVLGDCEEYRKVRGKKGNSALLLGGSARVSCAVLSAWRAVITLWVPWVQTASGRRSACWAWCSCGERTLSHCPLRRPRRPR